MMITHEWIERAREAGACAEAIDWLSSRPRTLEEMAAYEPKWVLWAAGKVDGAAEAIGAELIDRCAKMDPVEALYSAAHLLTAERIDWCAKREPWLALQHAAHLLTPERLDWCAGLEPALALQHAAELLTLERLDWCAELEPETALLFAAHLLTPKRLDWCAQREPEAAMHAAAELLTAERRRWCEGRKTFTVFFDGEDVGTITARTSAQALAEAVKWVNPADYDTSGGTVYVDITVRAEGDVAETTVTIHPPQPPCVGGDHDWRSPRWLGGCEDNPGVWAHGGGIYYREVCAHCGTYRLVDTWATREDTGEVGYDSVTYEDADEASLGYVLSRRLRDLADSAKGDGDIDAAVASVLGHGTEWRWGRVPPDVLDEHQIYSIEDVEDVIDRVKDALESTAGG